MYILYNSIFFDNVTLFKSAANLSILNYIIIFRAESPGRYYELNIHYGLFVGGMGDFNKVFLGNQKNFRGCMEVNFIFLKYFGGKIVI